MSAQLTQTPLCVAAGVGAGNGAAFARRFAAEGICRRVAGPHNRPHAQACDVGDPAGGMGAQRSVIASLFAAAA